MMIDKAVLYKKIEELQSILNRQDTAYDYEKAFDEKWREISKEVFNKSGEWQKVLDLINLN